MHTQAAQAVAYLAEARRCEEAAAQATRGEVAEAYRLLAQRWKDLARQIETFAVTPPK